MFLYIDIKLNSNGIVCSNDCSRTGVWDLFYLFAILCTPGGGYPLRYIIDSRRARIDYRVLCLLAIPEL